MNAKSLGAGFSKTCLPSLLQLYLPGHLCPNARAFCRSGLGMTIRRYTASSTAGYSWIEVDHGRRGQEEEPMVEWSLGITIRCYTMSSTAGMIVNLQRGKYLAMI